MNPITAPANSRRLRILVVDADPDTRSLYSALLTLVGWEAIEATDGRDALVKAFSESPALVITETRLPILDGYALCAVLRNDSATRRIPIVVVTTETRIPMLERVRASGVNAVLNKSVTADALLSEIRRLLEQAERSRQSADVLSSQSELKRPPLLKTHKRMRTTTPPAQPPSLICPECLRLLRYELSHVGGVSHRHAEQWDTFVCQTCGRFEYRQRTRKLRHIA